MFSCIPFDNIDRKYFYPCLTRRVTQLYDHSSDSSYNPPLISQIKRCTCRHCGYILQTKINAALWCQRYVRSGDVISVTSQCLWKSTQTSWKERHLRLQQSFQIVFWWEKNFGNSDSFLGWWSQNYHNA